MGAVALTIHLPEILWHAVRALAPHEGDANTVILRALEDYITGTAKRRGSHSGKYKKLVQALSTPVADLHLSARPATALQTIKITYVDELVQKSPTDLFSLPNFGNSRCGRSKRRWRIWG